jgi:protein O-mannosyl-transferase
MLIRALLLFVLPFVAYSFMLSSPFKTMDDQFSIVTNPLIKDTSQMPQLFAQGYFNDKSYYRPLVNLSFMAEYHLFNLDAFFYNLDNVLIHIVNAYLVWALVSILVNRQFAFWVALLFAIHPVQWEPIANISGRAILLSTMFSLASFIAFLKDRRILALFLFVPALLCKESAAVLPGILGVYCLLNKKSLRWVWAWGAVIIGYLFLRHALGITEIFPWRNMYERGLGFLTFLRSVMTHIRLFFFPADLHFDRSMPLFKSYFEAGAQLTIFIWIAIICGLGIARKSIKPLYWFCLAWFALDLLPVSQIITTIGVNPGRISTAEHFLYLASIPVYILMVKGSGRVGNYLQSRRFFSAQGLRVLTFALLSFLLLITIEQSIYARDEEVMMKRSLGFHPENARLQASVGLINAMRGEFKTAEEHFRKAIEGDPLSVRYRMSLAQSMCDQNKWIACMGQFMAVDDPGIFRGLLVKNTRRAFEHIAADLAAGRELDEKGWLTLGNYYAKNGNMDEAIKAYQKVLSFNPDNPDALFNLGSLSDAKQDWPNARRYFQKLVTIESAVGSLRKHAQNRLKAMP